MATGSVYPRTLRPKELDLLEGVLPADRPGYLKYREMIGSMVILAEGRRGAGSYVLGLENAQADDAMPLTPVIAYGMVEATHDTYIVAIREMTAGRIDVEIMSGSGDDLPDHFEERRRWTYSTWRPGEPSPATGNPVRQVAIDGALTLAAAREEKRIWVHDAATGMNHLLPVTNLHNELMLVKGIRDPGLALDPGRFFADLGTYSDDDLRAAFVAYNNVKRRVTVNVPPSPVLPGGIFQSLKRFFKKPRP